MRDFPSTTFLRVRAVRVAGFRGSGFRRGWGGWGLPLAGLGLGLGYYGYSSYYSDPCVVLTGVAPAPAGPLFQSTGAPSRRVNRRSRDNRVASSRHARQARFVPVQGRRLGRVS